MWVNLRINENGSTNLADLFFVFDIVRKRFVWNNFFEKYTGKVINLDGIYVLKNK